MRSNLTLQEARKEESAMTSEPPSSGSSALLDHLLRFPEDLRDIRRLRRRFRLSALDLSRVLAHLPRREDGSQAGEAEGPATERGPEAPER